MLGINEKTAKFALERNGNDVTRAADYVFSGAAGKDESSSLIMGALDRDRGRSSRNMFGLKRATSPTTPPKPAGGSSRSAVIQPSKPVGADSGHKESRSARAPSPFFRARRNREKQRERERSPEVGPLVKDTESDGESVVDTASARGGLKKFRPQASAYDDTDVEGDDSGSDGDRGTEAEDSDDSIDEHHGHDDAESLAEDEEIFFDEETEKNTEVNAFFLEGDAAGLGGESAVPEDDGRDVLDNFGEEVEEDILGEGPNVVVPPQPLFPVANAQPAKSSTTKKGLDLTTSRPSFARDRCTINLTHGDPDDALEESGKRLRRYVVLSDMSDESRYAVEWAIGTVARDGDEIFVISVKEDESKVDPKNWSDSDRAQKIKIQKERQTTTLVLVRQVTSLLQRTRLNITVTCQFLHAKNARHMLLDLIDFLEPTMVIVGSRGLGQLKGILLGSTSHYLVQKSSVPVMVARRRLQRPLRKTNPANLRHSPRVSLASASIEKAATSKQEDENLDVATEEDVKAEEAQRRNAEK